MADARWIRAAKISDIAEGAGVVFGPEDQKIAVFKSGGNFFAIDNTCPHRGGPLAEGYVENFEVICPWHAWTFDVKTGACISVPGVQINTYLVKTEGDDVFVQLR